MSAETAASTSSGSETSADASPGSLPQASTSGDGAQLSQQTTEDPEIDLGGEKLPLSEVRKIYASRKEIERASHERFRTAAEQRKQLQAERDKIQAALQQVKQDPAAFLREIGIDPREFSEQQLRSILQQQMMTPEQREAAELRQQLQQRDAMLKQIQEERQQQQAAAARQRHIQEFDRQIADALGSTDLPRTPESVQAVARVMAEAWQSGDRIDAKTAAFIVAQEHQEKVQYYINAAIKSGRIAQTLSPEAQEAYRKALLTQATEKAQAAALPRRPRPQAAQAKAKQPERPPTPEEVTQRLMKQFASR